MKPARRRLAAHAAPCANEQTTSCHGPNLGSRHLLRKVKAAGIDTLALGIRMAARRSDLLARAA